MEPKQSDPNIVLVNAKNGPIQGVVGMGTDNMLLWVNSKAGSSRCWEVTPLCRVPPQVGPEAIGSIRQARGQSGKAETDISRFNILPV